MLVRNLLHVDVRMWSRISKSLIVNRRRDARLASGWYWSNSRAIPARENSMLGIFERSSFLPRSNDLSCFSGLGAIPGLKDCQELSDSKSVLLCNSSSILAISASDSNSSAS